MRDTLNNKQILVYDWLNDRLQRPVFAEAYKGAAILINQKPAGYVSFVAHAGRDMMNLLAASVAGITSGRVQYPQHLDELQLHWREEWRHRDDLSPEVIANGHLIPTEVCERISILINEHKSGRLRSSQADTLFFSTFLDYSDRDKIPANFLSEWKAAKNWFMRHVHLRPLPFRAETDNDLVKHFNCLDEYLYIAASSRYDRLRDLNEILDATNN